MELREIENGIRATDGAAKSAGGAVADLRSRAEQCAARAASLEDQAEEMLREAYRAQDPDTADSCRSRADSLEYQARQYRDMEEDLRAQLEQEYSILRSCREAYENYRSECGRSIQNLRVTAEKLNQAAKSGYGLEKIREALALIRTKNSMAVSLQSACESRIQWIDTVAGSDGDPYVRVLRR